MMDVENIATQAVRFKPGFERTLGGDVDRSVGLQDIDDAGCDLRADPPDPCIVMGRKLCKADDEIGFPRIDIFPGNFSGW